MKSYKWSMNGWKYYLLKISESINIPIKYLAIDNELNEFISIGFIEYHLLQNNNNNNIEQINVRLIALKVIEMMRSPNIIIFFFLFFIGLVLII